VVKGIWSALRGPVFFVLCFQRPSLRSIGEAEIETTPVLSSSPIATVNGGNQSLDPALLQSLSSLNQTNQSSENDSSSAGELPSAPLAQPEFRGKGGSRRPNKSEVELTYDFRHDPFISQSFYELSLCPYANALEEAEADDFEELGSLDQESLASGSEATSDELFAYTPTLKLELEGGISNTEELSTGFGDSSSSLENSTLSVNPEAQLGSDSYWGSDYFPAADQTSGIRWNDPYRISGFQQALNTYGTFSKGVVDFATGFNDGFRSSVLLAYDPNYVPTDSLFYNSGRITGDVAAGIQGLAEIMGGGGLGGLGGVACLRGGCALGAPTIAAGSGLIAHGIFVTGSGAINLGKDLTNLFAQENGETEGAKTGARD
jgi:hypothetical protein